jgi:hypothetical protein
MHRTTALFARSFTSRHGADTASAPRATPRGASTSAAPPPPPLPQARTPPKHSIVEVRAVRRIGVVTTTSGPKQVNAGDVLTMLLADAEELIQRELVAVLSDAAC